MGGETVCVLNIVWIVASVTAVALFIMIFIAPMFKSEGEQQVTESLAPTEDCVIEDIDRDSDEAYSHMDENAINVAAVSVLRRHEHK